MTLAFHPSLALSLLRLLGFDCFMIAATQQHKCCFITAACVLTQLCGISGGLLVDFIIFSGVSEIRIARACKLGGRPLHIMQSGATTTCLIEAAGIIREITLLNTRTAQGKHAFDCIVISSYLKTSTWGQIKKAVMSS